MRFKTTFLLVAAGLLFAGDALAADRVSQNLVVLYTFEGPGGDVVRDRSDNGDPLDLKIENPKAVVWRDRQLAATSSAKIASQRPATKIIQGVRKSQELTVEVWLTPANVKQSGPARIVSLSANTSLRNFTLGQDGDKYDARLRTTGTSENGIPSLSTKQRTLTPNPTHVVYTHSRSGMTRIYVNGKVNAEQKIGGDLSNWDQNYRLTLANEATGDRPWQGAFGLVAIYDRALSDAEVTQNFAAGVDGKPGANSVASGDPHAADRMFATSVAPLLARSCVGCHDAAQKKGGLDLSHKGSALAGGESGKAIVPGKLQESLLWEQVSSGEMPPEGNPLSAAEKELLKKWINDGAAWSVDFLDPAIYASKSSSEVWVQRLTVLEYIETVRSAVGVDITQEAHELLPPDLRADGFHNTAYNLNVDLKHVEAYAQLARTIVDRMDVPKFARRFSSSASLNTDATARKFVGDVGQWMFRGPLEEREITNYSGILTSVASAGGKYEEGVSLMVEAMLQSPRFIYRIEWQQGSGARRPLDDFELASRLSYIVWGGPPDEALLKAAKEGKLTNGAAYGEQVHRMLKDPRARERSKQFVADWLNLDRLEHLRPNAKRFPEWDPALGSDMRDETFAYFEEVVWNQNRPLADLFNAQFTFATPRLAKFYGLTPKGDGLQRYDLASVPSRGGLLTQGSVLTIGGDDASMVTRGLFVLRDVLRGVISAPPSSVDTTPVPATPGMSLRKVAEQRVANQACGGCHQRFEPLAYGLERFDGLGAYRLKDEFGNALRADGELYLPGAAEPQKYQDAAELMKLLASSDRASETLTWKVTQFALGRPLGAAEAAQLQQIHKSAIEAGGTYSDLMYAICLSELVRTTRTE